MDILNKLGIKDVNFGGCSGPGNWTKGQNEGLTQSFNPANGELIASVYNCSKEEYTEIVKESKSSRSQVNVFSPEALRDKITTSAPHSLKEKAAALPIPLVPPQTNALLPSKLIIYSPLNS